ncbi:MAG TPA: alpha/beta fold hydrolase [Sediminibacterium sp.]|nr:alpha/beta fold hydrolase [Sediminibacterium sp.]
MKRFLFCIISCLLLGGTLNSQSITGAWGGKIDLGNRKLLFIMKVAQNGVHYTSTFDSPEQNAFDIKGGETTLTGDSLVARIPVLSGMYTGKWNRTDTISGTLQQGASKMPLVLVRMNEKDVPKKPAGPLRPQTPRPPFYYRSEEVEYNNADSTIHFGATLTLPTNKTDFPVVILISGSGTQDRDGNMFGHSSYWVLADYLTRQGIGVLRVDDRGIGSTTIGSNPTGVTSEDFAKDVEAGIEYLLRRKEVNPKKIGLIGHSEGGMIAPMVAARNNKVAFVVLLAGPGIPGNQVWKFQMRRNFVKTGLSPEDAAKAGAMVDAMNEPFKQSADYATIKKQMQETYSNWSAGNNAEEESRLLNTVGDKAYLNLLEQFRAGLTWLNYFMNYQPSINLSKLKCPVLAVNGESDIQVSAKENLEGIRAALTKGKNKQFTIRAFPNLNHLFQTSKSPAEPYSRIEETFSTEALLYISTWINNTTK